MSIVEKVQKDLFFYSSRKALSVLEGAYRSVSQARSMDFDDIREYVPGDNAKDIAWKASSKASKILVKRHVADRQQGVLFVVDTDKSFNAVLGDGSRLDTVEQVVGVLGQVVLNNNEKWGIMFGDADGARRLPFRGSLTHLEETLTKIRDTVQSSVHPADTGMLLEQVLKMKTPQSIIVVVSSGVVFTDKLETTVRKVLQKHDLLWVNVGDQDPFLLPDGKQIVDIMTSKVLPAFFKEDRNLYAKFSASEQEQRDRFRTFLTNNRVSFTHISKPGLVVPQLTEMLRGRTVYGA